MGIDCGPAPSQGSETFLPWLQDKQWKERQTLRWFFSRIDWKYFLRVREEIPRKFLFSYLRDGEYDALWQMEYDKRTLLRIPEATPSNALLRPPAPTKGTLMTSIRCYFLEPTGQVRRSLRRYRHNGVCPLAHGYHDASFDLDIVPRSEKQSSGDLWPHNDVYWPKACACGYRFTEQDEWQLFHAALYRRQDTGEVLSMQEFTPGAMWYADYMVESGVDWGYTPGPDGRFLHVRTPGGDWNIDSKCSNCTLPQDREHKCWVRHGSAPNITVDKNGRTCGAGAGSIVCGNYHGFLRNGFLEQC